MTIRELNRAYRRAGLISPFRPYFLAPVLLGGLIGLSIHVVGGALIAAFSGVIVVWRGLNPAVFHTLAWTCGPSRRSLALAHLVSASLTATVLGASAGLVSGLMARDTGESGTSEIGLGPHLLFGAGVALALVPWLVTFVGILNSRFVPARKGVQPFLILAFTGISAVPLLLFQRLGPFTAFLAYVLPGFALAFLLFESSEWRPLSDWDSDHVLWRLWRARKDLRRSPFGPLRALFWPRHPRLACLLAGAITATALVLFFTDWEEPDAHVWAYLPCLLSLVSFVYPLPWYNPAYLRSLHLWGLDLRRQRRIHFWFVLGLSSFLSLLCLGLSMVLGEAKFPEELPILVLAWSAQILVCLSGVGCISFLVLGCGSAIVYQWESLRERSGQILSWIGSIGPARESLALLLALAACFVLRRAWRASGDGSPLEEAQLTSPAPWAKGSMQGLKYGGAP